MNLLNIEFKDAQGETKTLSDYQAKAYLVVNTASRCGLTPQYQALQALYTKYKGQGLEVVAFPANEFLAQEPGTDEEIQNFCQSNFGVDFPVNKKIIVKGEGQHPLYQALTQKKPVAFKKNDGALEEKLRAKGLIDGNDQDIHWNFEKFLLSSTGEIVERFFPDVAPDDSVLVEKIEQVLKA